MAVKLSKAAKEAQRDLTCQYPGPMSAWTVERTQAPKCNRTNGHGGPHRRYTKKAEILAEWTDGEIPK